MIAAEKVVDWDVAQKLREQSKREGRRTVFTNGCFDLLHPGHVRLLEQAKALGDVLIVGLNSDASVTRLKGSTRPINSQDDRAYVLGGLQAVDMVVVFTEDTPLRLIEALRPDVLVKGGDYTEDSIVGAPLVRAMGGDVVIVPLVEGKATTALVEKIRAE